LHIQRKPNETFEKMLKRFSRKVRKLGILSEVENRRYYEKPSVKRHHNNRRRRKSQD
jgi:ribosomal protein S21